LGPSGKRQLAPHTFPTATDAGVWLSGVETDMAQGNWRAPEQLAETFGDYGRRWLDQRVLAPRTRETYGHLWRKWLEPAFGAVPLSDLSVEQWRSWYTERQADGRSVTSVAKAYKLARGILNQAVEDGRLKVNPCRVKGAGAEHAAERPVLMPDQVLRLAEATEPRYRLMVLLAAFCSLRFAELVGLKRARLDLLHRVVVIEETAVELSGRPAGFGPPTSAAGRRHVTLPPELVELVEQHLAAHVGPRPDALVFPGPDGDPPTRNQFRTVWGRACRRAGISGVHLHDLRGSGSTWAAQGGATVREIMARLGHETPMMAMRYQHATKERDQVIADKLGALWRAAAAQPAEDTGPMSYHRSGARTGARPTE
jgi:integrase